MSAFLAGAIIGAAFGGMVALLFLLGLGGVLARRQAKVAAQAKRRPAERTMVRVPIEDLTPEMQDAARRFHQGSGDVGEVTAVTMMGTPDAIAELRRDGGESCR